MSLGFLLSSTVACAPVDRHAVAREDDRLHGTGTFTWLVDHEPSALVVWHVDAGTVRALLPQSRIDEAAATNVCAQAKSAHALLLLVEPASARGDRDAAEDCGFALDRDAGALVVAPR